MDKKDAKVSLLFRFKNLRITMLIPFVLISTMAVLSFMFISVRQSKETVLETSTDYTRQLIDMVNGDIDSYISNMENIAQLVMNNSDVRDFLFINQDGLSRKEYYRSQAQEQFRTLRDTRDDIYNIGIIGENGNYLINDESVLINPYADLNGMEWYKKAIEGNGEITSSHVQNIVKGEYKWVVTLSRGIKSPETGNTEGVLFIDLNYSSISSLCEKISLGSKGYVFIIDNDGTVIYHPKQQLLYSGIQTEEIDKILAKKAGSFLSEDKKVLYTVSKSETTGWTVVGVAYLNELMEKSNQTRLLYMLLAVGIICIATAISMLLSDTIARPIRELRNSMKQVEHGNLEISIENPGYDNEIGDLIRSFSIMIARIKQLLIQSKEEQEEKRKSELNALQAQINPHFLYNTLDSIIWMAEGKKIKEVILMTSSLSKLLRRSISNQQEFVLIENEIDYAREYLKIQQMRYHDKLDYEIEVDSRIAKQHIAKLIVQPLVENAIYHGIKLKEGKGCIKIIGLIENDMTVIKVVDDGVGMSEEELSRIFEERVPTDQKKVGVLNVHRRIKLYYGEEYGLSYESKKGVGTSVSILLPYTNGWEGTYERLS